MSRPLMTIPTTRPRSEGSAMWAANQDEQLRRDRGDADDQARRRQPVEARGGGAPPPGHDDRPEHRQDERPPLQSIAQGARKAACRVVA